MSRVRDTATRSEMGRVFRLLRSAPATERCERCGVGGTPLAVVDFEAVRLRARRTLCEYCVLVLFEAFMETDEAFAKDDEHEEVLALVR
jgi:hypothetical protein